MKPRTYTDPHEHKECNGCHQFKPVTAFRMRDDRDRPRSKCRRCENIDRAGRARGNSR
jgi:hypothetical protein